MRDYKLLLAGLILLLLIIFIAIFTWLWTSNRKNMDPLPIMANNNDTSVVKIISNNPDPESNETEVTERNESIPSSTQLAEHQTGNPMVIIILALLSIVFVRLKRE